MNLNEALRIKTEKRMHAIEEAEKKTSELHSLIPRVAEIDAATGEMPMRLFAGEDAQKLRAETDALFAERERLLAACGFEKDWDAPRFECAECSDGGYCGLKLCSCVKKLLTSESFSSGVLGSGLCGKSFDNFSLSYYRGDSEKNAENILACCKKYASDFPVPGAGLLFSGGTGLGKTHLSAAIASEVAGNGHSVVYESAQQICDTCDAVRFGKKDDREKARYESCELLIIDDLGAECVTQYSVASFSNLINLRMVAGKQTVISTNLSPAALSKTYGERVLSRLLGEFRLLLFKGSDIRMQKLKEGSN